MLGRIFVTDRILDDLFVVPRPIKLSYRIPCLPRESYHETALPPPWKNADINNPINDGAVGRRRSSLLEIGSRVIDISKELGRSVREAAEGELRNEVIQFGHTTTAHGIPMVLSARKWTVRFFWIWLSIASACCFFYQCTLVTEKFRRKEKLVNVELQFESAPFPAITVCNLNPFKRHLARTVPEISDTLDAFHQAVTYSKDAMNHYVTDSRGKRSTNGRPGGFRYVQYEPVYGHCQCPKAGTDCVHFDSVPPNNRSICICNYDRQDSSAWPCFNSSSWTEETCPECNDIGYCNLPNTAGNKRFPCLCQQDVKYCLIRPDRLKRIWEFRGRQIPDETSPFRDDFLQQLKELGYENMTDEVAITTTTKERMVFMMAELPIQRRIALSYGKSEFIRMCSFNGKQCDIITDFKLHVDPTFGNCYTFNANKQTPLFSGRAGPSYGLRLMVFVNVSDYLPTTEATGVRIAIHDRNECPFPDTFGYSAPTGFVSSFGLSMRKVNRLLEPEGNCVRSSEHRLSSDHIYRQYKYEPEGCHRNCYQNHIVDHCGCADPRYPTANNATRLCSHHDDIARTCMLREGIRFTTKNDCQCRFPCQRDVYTTTYSAARWPSGSFQVGDCTGDAEHCIAYYSSNAVMLEIYYEQMSYEILTEAESYAFVNLVSDIGGQAGLWLGASVITICELFVFLLRILTIYCRKRGDSDNREEENVPSPRLVNRRKLHDRTIDRETTFPDSGKASLDEGEDQFGHHDNYCNDNRLNAINANHYEK